MIANLVPERSHFNKAIVIPLLPFPHSGPALDQWISHNYSTIVPRMRDSTKLLTNSHPVAPSFTICTPGIAGWARKLTEWQQEIPGWPLAKSQLTTKSRIITWFQVWIVKRSKTMNSTLALSKEKRWCRHLPWPLMRRKQTTRNWAAKQAEIDELDNPQVVSTMRD